ncbi:MAG: DUF4375 domain-containing protein [Acidimicrobiia bacterium]
MADTSDDDFRVAVSNSDGERLAWDAVDRIWFTLSTPYEPDARLATLTPGQRAVYSLLWTYSEIGNGGLHQYFFNSTGYLLPEAIAGAELLDQPELARELRNAAALFGDPYARDRDERAAVLQRLPDPDDPFWDGLDDVVYPLLERLADHELSRYITQNPEEFFLPS